MALDPKDGGYKSRKFWFAMWSTWLIAWGAWYGAGHAGFAPLYDPMVGGILGVVAAFLTGNIASKFVTGKAINEAAKVAKSTPELEGSADAELEAANPKKK